MTELGDRVGDGVGQVPLCPVALIIAVVGGAVAHVDVVGPPRDLDDRCGGAVRTCEMPGKAFGVDRGGGDDDLQIGAAGE